MARTSWLLVAATLVAGCAGVDPPGTSHDQSVATDELGPGDDLVEPADLATAGAVVDLANVPTCNPANKTLSAAVGPDVCVYGERCDDVTTHCAAVAVAACGMVAGAPTWNQSGKLAPVITKASAVLLSTTSSTTECAGGDPAALVTIELYAPSFLTTSNNATTFAQHVKWRKSTISTDAFLNATFVRVLPTPSQKFVSFQVGINCGGASGSLKQAGLYVLDEGGHVSNSVCVSW